MKPVECTLRLSRHCQQEMWRKRSDKDAVCFPCKLERNRARQRDYWDRKGKAKRDGPLRSLNDMKGATNK